MARLERLKELEEFEMEQKQAEYEQDKKKQRKTNMAKKCRVEANKG